MRYLVAAIYHSVDAPHVRLHEMMRIFSQDVRVTSNLRIRQPIRFIFGLDCETDRNAARAGQYHLANFAECMQECCIGMTERILDISSRLVMAVLLERFGRVLSLSDMLVCHVVSSG
jgi:hypothetical protein